jgi:hypothetical protein
VRGARVRQNVAAAFAFEAGLLEPGRECAQRWNGSGKEYAL